MFVHDKILVEILKDIKNAVNVNSVQLEGAHNINGFFVFCIN